MDIQNKWSSKVCWGSHFNICQNNLRTKLIKKGRKEHYIDIKGKIHQEDTAIINNYAPNLGSPKFVKEPYHKLKLHIALHT